LAGQARGAVVPADESELTPDGVVVLLGVQVGLRGKAQDTALGRGTTGLESQTSMRTCWEVTRTETRMGPPAYSRALVTNSEVKRTAASVLGLVRQYPGHPVPGLSDTGKLRGEVNDGRGHAEARR